MERFSSRLQGIILVVLVMVLTGCANTPPTRFFVLNPVSGVAKMGNPGGDRCFAIGIGPLKIPEYLNQPEIVTRITPNEVRVDEFAKWAEPLENNISRALAENLSSRLCLRTISLFPWRGQPPIDYRIEMQVIQMDGILGESALLDVVWSLMEGNGHKQPPLLTKRAKYKEPAGGGGPGAFVSAQSRNLASLSREIAEAILEISK
jgi:uncharacterized protein